MSKVNNILPGAWEPKQDDVKYEIFSLHVPTAWQQVAQSLASKRANGGFSKYSSVPVSSVDPIITASFPQIIKTQRFGWQRPGIPWLFATEVVNIALLPIFVKDWLREEFSWCLGEEEVDSRLENLNDDDWCWEEEPITNPFWYQQDSEYKIDFRFQVLPNYLAKEFLKNPTICFDGNAPYQLTFYQVVRLDQGAELMSWPPHRVPLIKVVKEEDIKQEQVIGEAYISFVIQFKLHTVPWRSQPMIYHQLSIRRWIAEPLERLPYRGASAYIGDNRRWLDGLDQPFCFIPLAMKRLGRKAQWSRAISELLKINDSSLPEPEALAQQPKYNWSAFGENPTGIQVAIAYDTRHRGDAPCMPGVSPLDLASLDRAIQNRVEQKNFPVSRVGEAIMISGKFVSFWEPGKPQKRGSKEPKNRDDLSTPMLRAKIVIPATFRSTENHLYSILILWETQECRDALIAEICELFSLSLKGETTTYVTPTGAQGEEIIYQGSHGSLRIKTQHVQDLTQKLDIDSSIKANNRQQKRVNLMDERINKIKSSLPKPEGLSGALIEIRPKKSYFPPESDPKLALRIGAMKAGYVNQHFHALTGRMKWEKERDQNRVRRAVTDLLRQFGILPAPLIDPEKDGIESNMWLTCFYILRRTRKTTASNKAATVALMVRVNPIKGTVQLTTPSLFPTWVSYPEALEDLVYEKWNPDFYADEQKSSDIKQEQKLLNKFVTHCLRDCLSTQIEQHQYPRVLFMAEAQNARKMLTWLHNPELPANGLPKGLDLTESETNRLWMVRLRVANNDEVPVAIVKDSPSSRSSIGGIFRWQNVCDRAENAVYFSLRKLLKTEQKLLRRSQSRLDNGSRPAGNPKLLEIAIVHYPGIERDKLAGFVHSLRNRWPYFADDVSLPFPFPFATLAKEYAVSTKDEVELEDLEELEDVEEFLQ
ncbi:pPIWI_RE module domain-containing protein [Scytonema sp. NUACC26]|uniref:pPIWI_RE module domain-containing protein n=1 Tax=Scytonema sp. NUACC26 TaxID=3140176 RepID=UPI0034DCB58D